MFWSNVNQIRDADFEVVAHIACRIGGVNGVP